METGSRQENAPKDSSQAKLHVSITMPAIGSVEINIGAQIFASMHFPILTTIEKRRGFPRRLDLRSRSPT
jgi:hypothetical protein